MIPIPLPVNASKEPLSSPASASPSIERKYKPAKPFLAIVVHLFPIPFPVLGGPLLQGNLSHFHQ